MGRSGKLLILTVVALLFGGFAIGSHAQAKLTYPEINTALQTKLPNQSFRTRSELIAWVIVQVTQRKIDKPLTRDREDDLRQAGATDELVAAIRANSPPLENPDKDPDLGPTIVKMGDLANQATRLIRPESTAAAIKDGTSGTITLQLTVDELGRVVGVKPLNELPSGLTDQAVTAARQSRFTPVNVRGKPVKFTGTIKYTFANIVTDPYAALTEADDLRRRGECDQAMPLYHGVIAADPKPVKAYFGRALCQMMRSSYDKSIADLESAAKIDPRNGDYFFFLGVAFDLKGDAVGAAPYYAKSVNLKPELNKFETTTCLYIEKKQISKGEVTKFANSVIDGCNASLKLQNTLLTGLFYLKRGIGFRLKRDYDQAIKDFETARTYKPVIEGIRSHLHAAYNARGLVYFEAKDYKRAFADITKSIEFNPEHPISYINRCIIYLYGMKDADSAIQDCSTAIRLTDRSSTAYSHRGFAYELKKDIDKAVADYRKALDIDPRNEMAKTNLERVQGPSMRKSRPKN